MEIPVTISTEWIQQHATIAAWLLGTGAVGLLSLAGYLTKRLFDAINKGLGDIKDIKEVQTVQAENHLRTIQDASLATRDETIKTNVKLDTLITVMERKL